MAFMQQKSTRKIFLKIFKAGDYIQQALQKLLRKFYFLIIEAILNFKLFFKELI